MAQAAVAAAGQLGNPAGSHNPPFIHPASQPASPPGTSNNSPPGEPQHHCMSCPALQTPAGRAGTTEQRQRRCCQSLGACWMQPGSAGAVQTGPCCAVLCCCAACCACLCELEGGGLVPSLLQAVQPAGAGQLAGHHRVGLQTGGWVGGWLASILEHSCSRRQWTVGRVIKAPSPFHPHHLKHRRRRPT